MSKGMLKLLHHTTGPNRKLFNANVSLSLHVFDLWFPAAVKQHIVYVLVSGNLQTGRCEVYIWVLALQLAD